MFIFLLLSLVLMISDNKIPAFAKIRSSLSVAVLPIQYLVNEPIKFVEWVDYYFTDQKALFVDNVKLRTKSLLLQAKLQRLLTLEKENAQLRALLSSSDKINSKVRVAQLLTVNLSPLDPQVVLNTGSKHRVYLGQPVVDAYGVMGQVIDVSPFTCRVLLITSTRSAVPVQDNRSGVRAVVMGQGVAGKLKLMQLTDTADVKPGDVLVTSGLGLKFPIGYPVGVISEVNHVVGDRFAQITVTPSAHLDRSRQVLLVWGPV